MVERQPLNYTDKKVWPTYRLEKHSVELEETLKVPHNEERLADTRHKLAGAAFELVQRELDIQRREHEIETLEILYEESPE
jgi:hypothetical protein